MATGEHLVIDGYNVIHAWKSLLPNCARHDAIMIDALAERVRIIHDFDGIRTTIVFDGNGRKVDIQRPSKEMTFSLLFTPKGMSADAFIEQLTAKNAMPQSMTIVTQDAMIQEVVMAYGALCITPESLEKRIEHCEKRLADHLKRRHKGHL